MEFCISYTYIFKCEYTIKLQRIGSEMTEVHRECRDIKVIVTALNCTQNQNSKRIKRLEIQRHKRKSQRSRLRHIPTLPGEMELL